MEKSNHGDQFWLVFEPEEDVPPSFFLVNKRLDEPALPNHGDSVAQTKERIGSFSFSIIYDQQDSEEFRKETDQLFFGILSSGRRFFLIERDVESNECFSEILRLESQLDFLWGWVEARVALCPMMSVQSAYLVREDETVDYSTRSYRPC